MKPNNPPSPGEAVETFQIGSSKSCFTQILSRQGLENLYHLLNSPQATIYFTKIRDKESNVVQTKQQLNFPPADLVDDWFLLTG